MRTPAAIALFLYKRPEHARRAIEALRANTLAAESLLYVFCDAARDETDAASVARVRSLAAGIEGFRSIVLRTAEAHLGLARSIISGVSEVFSTHSRAIIVEDDLVLSPEALRFFNAMLERFERAPRVSAIAGFAYPPDVMRIPRDYQYDLFCTPRLKSWGWATWRHRWAAVDWGMPGADRLLSSAPRTRAFCAGGDDLPHLLRLERTGQTDSWAVRWDYHQYQTGGVCLHPCLSYVARLDLGDPGTHGRAVDPSLPPSALNRSVHWRVPPEVTLDVRINRAYRSLYDRVSPRRSLRYRSPDYCRRALGRRLGIL